VTFQAAERHPSAGDVRPDASTSTPARRSSWTRRPATRTEEASSRPPRGFQARFGGKDKGRNKRENYALDLFREAAAYLDDPTG